MPRNLTTATFVCLCLAGLASLWSIAEAEPPPSPVEEQIRRALEGQSSEIEPQDGILADILGLIEERGSVLDGTSLDTDIGSKTANELSADTARARAAEQLLKASRLLEKLPATTPDRSKLVNGMRAEAVKLLTE